MIALPWSSHHVPLATGLLGHFVVHVTAKTASHLVVQVLRRVFGEVAGALAPRDHGDHPGVPWYCLGWEGCGGSGDHEVAWWGGVRVGGEGESREGQRLEVTPAHAGVIVLSLEGTVGVEVFHGAIERFIHWGRKKGKKSLVMNKEFVLLLCFSETEPNTVHLTLALFVISTRRAGGERHPRQYPEVGVQRGGHDQALRRGHRCNRNLCHICGRDIQGLCFAGCTNPPHLSETFYYLVPLSFTNTAGTWTLMTFTTLYFLGEVK